MRRCISCHAGGVVIRTDRAAGNRLRWYRVVYAAAYLLRLVVWQRPTPPSGLVALVEGGAGAAAPEPLPAGRALELGCGTGVDAIYLAEHGWDVTAVDITVRALGIARRAAARAGVTPRFVRGDVTRLPELGLGHDYDLLLDFGCLHTLPADRRPAYLDGVTQAAKAGATLLVYGFRRPPRPAPMFAGLAEEEVRHRFGPAGWEVVAAEPAPDDLSPTGRRSGARFELWRYQLRRSR
jgi:SAM-dependent methyltransferase